MKGKFKATLWTALGAAIGFFGLVLMADWGHKNDIPGLKEVYKVLSGSWF